MDICFKIVMDIKCLQCKTSFQNINEVSDFNLSIQGEGSIKEAFESYFDCETVEKYNCMGCMKGVSASKERKLYSSPQWLCFLMNGNKNNIRISRFITLKCFTDSNVCYWKYGLTCGIGWKESQESNSERSYCYKRFEEVFTNESKDLPTIIIDSDDESVNNETKAKNTEVKVVAVDDIHEFLTEVKAKPTTAKIPEPVRARERSKRIVNRNRQFLGENAAVSSSATSSTPSNNPAADLPSKTPIETKPPDDDIKTSNALPKVSKKSVKKSNKFIRFRFQIDCAAANDVDVDRLIGFFKKTLKIDGKTDNLKDVGIERRNSHINILAKVMLKKKYLKLLTKKYLKKQKLWHYHVIAKNKRAYKIVLK